MKSIMSIERANGTGLFVASAEVLSLAVLPEVLAQLYAVVEFRGYQRGSVEAERTADGVILKVRGHRAGDAA